MATIKEIADLLAGVDNLESPLFIELSKDKRRGVQIAIQKRQKELQVLLAEEERLEAMLSYEKTL